MGTKEPIFTSVPSCEEIVILVPLFLISRAICFNLASFAVKIPVPLFVFWRSLRSNSDPTVTFNNKAAGKPSGFSPRAGVPPLAEQRSFQFTLVCCPLLAPRLGKCVTFSQRIFRRKSPSRDFLFGSPWRPIYLLFLCMPGLLNRLSLLRAVLCISAASQYTEDAIAAPNAQADKPEAPGAPGPFRIEHEAGKWWLTTAGGSRFFHWESVVLTRG